MVYDYELLRRFHQRLAGTFAVHPNLMVSLAGCAVGPQGHGRCRQLPGHCQWVPGDCRDAGGCHRLHGSQWQPQR